MTFLILILIGLMFLTRFSCHFVLSCVLDHSAHLGGFLFRLFVNDIRIKPFAENISSNSHSLSYSSSSFTISYWRWQQVKRRRVWRRLRCYSLEDGSSSSLPWWSISSWIGQFISSSSILLIFSLECRMTYSTVDVFLKPLMLRFNSTRGAVSAIFSILPAITLGAGWQSSLLKKKRIFSSVCTGPIATTFTITYGCQKVTMVGVSIAALGFLDSYFYPSIWVY